MEKERLKKREEYESDNEEDSEKPCDEESIEEEKVLAEPFRHLLKHKAYTIALLYFL